MSDINYVRVADTNGEFTTSDTNAKSLGLAVLEKPAVDQNGRPLPAKPKVAVKSASTAKTPSKEQ